MAIFLEGALAASLAAAPSASLTAGDFLSRAEPLVKRSMVSLMFSSEARSLMRMIGEAAQQSRTKLDADRAAGKPVTTCLPPPGKANINSTELLAYIRSLSPQQRTQPFNVAFSGYVARKYPCRR